MENARFELLTNGTGIYISGDVRFGFDSLLLADFTRIKNGGRLLDVGAGCGIVPLKLRDGGRSFRCVAAELDELACSLMERSFSENGLGGFAVFRGDARTFRYSEKFDAVASNPPYFSEGKRSGGEYRARARHDGELTLAELCEIAAKNLKQGGSLFFCCRPESIQRALAGMSENKLSLKRLRFVRESPGEEPWLLLLEARYRAGEGAKVMPDFIVRGPDGNLTDEMQKITAPCRKEDNSAR